ncbi:restriction endonuclease subunit S [Aeromonas veronii]|uniref:restriction endonuclease subunit S n=1 Tax=Aeromonas veronii TaxID=654 RepID=UPI001BCFCAF5|nr:restriction endonuclease subunit S [Aeromonas veronii]MBS4723066.1 restriction endonuclease subunit S [Aeromonas veronii]
MSSEWQTFSVEELVTQRVLAPPLDGNHGAIHPKTSDFVPTGIPFIMASDMKDGIVDTTNCAFITQQQATTLRKGFAKTGDVLLSHKATIGRTALVGDIETDYIVLTPQVTYYRVLDTKRLNNRYLKYYFDSAHFQQILGAWAGAGSTRAYLGITAQRKLPVVLPPIDLQNEIANVAGALDDRIALLRETNATLEAIAQALFKSWFVDFDPVHARARGEQPQGLAPEVAALFPDSFEEFELGMVPQGWAVGTLSEICSISSGKRPPERSDELSDECHIPLYGGAGLMGYTSASLFETPRIVTGRVGTLGKVHVAYPPFWASDNVLVLTPAEDSIFAFCLHWVSAIDVHALNRGSSQPLLTQKDLGAQLGVIPLPEVLVQFEATVSPLYKQIRANLEQAQTLANLRDTLLPRLISGQLRLPDAEQQLKDLAV